MIVTSVVKELHIKGLFAIRLLRSMSFGTFEIRQTYIMKRNTFSLHKTSSVGRVYTYL